MLGIPTPTTYVDALQTARTMFDASTPFTASERLRTLAELSELPEMIRPGTGLVSRYTYDDVARSLRATAASVDDGSRGASSFVRVALHPDTAGPDALRSLQELMRLPDAGAPTAETLATRATDDAFNPAGKWFARLRSELDAPTPTLLPELPRGRVTPLRVDELPEPHVSEFASREAPGQLGFGDLDGPSELDAAYAKLHAAANERADVVRNVLRTGTLRELGADVTIGSGRNVHGELDVREVVLGDERIKVVVMTGEQGERELFGARVAQRLGAGRLAPTAERTADGSIVVELREGSPDGLSAHLSRMDGEPFRPGGAAGDYGVYLAEHLEEFVARGYTAQLGVGPDQARAFARRDAQLMRAFDYIIANDDRHYENVLLHPDGRASWVDPDRIGVGEQAGTRMEPLARGFSVTDEATLREQLDPGVLDHLRRTLTPEQLRADASADLRPEDHHLIDGMVARLEALREHGTITWHPTTKAD